MTTTVYTDEDGLLLKYVCSFTYKGQEHGFTLWASSREEAQEMLRAIGETGGVNGRMIEELPMRWGAVMTSEMTHPTDDELEAMAVKILGEHLALRQMVGSDPETTTSPASKAAAMLRACKGSDHAELEAQLLDVSKREAAMMARYDAKLEAAEAQRDALRANLDEAQAALRWCMDEIDGYVRQECPGDHPVHERYRNRDFFANPARVYFEYRKATP